MEIRGLEFLADLVDATGTDTQVHVQFAEQPSPLSNPSDRFWPSGRFCWVPRFP